jgi:hypothetical protein
MEKNKKKTLTYQESIAQLDCLRKKTKVTVRSEDWEIQAALDKEIKKALSLVSEEAYSQQKKLDDSWFNKILGNAALGFLVQGCAYSFIITLVSLERGQMHTLLPFFYSWLFLSGFLYFYHKKDAESYRYISPDLENDLENVWAKVNDFVPTQQEDLEGLLEVVDEEKLRLVEKAD